jgi:hypothetical protein
VENPHFPIQRRNALADLDYRSIDTPIREIVKGFNALAYCFTMQSCYGHFLYKGQMGPHNHAPLPADQAIDSVDYRIAYLALCIKNSVPGKMLMEQLSGIANIDPLNIQFCSAEWFWKRQVNSYALQVEPDRFKYQDRATLGLKEALHIEKIRNELYRRLRVLLQKLSGDQ